MIENEIEHNVNDSQNPKKKKVVKYLLNFTIFFVLIYLTFHILLKDQNMEELLNTVVSAKIHFILLGLLCMVIFYLCEAVNMRRTLQALGEKCNLLMTVKYTLIGAFFSAITPAASGGQPMQIVYMHRDGIKVSSSTTALLLNLMSFQVVTILMELISAAFLHDYMDAGVTALFTVGIILNFSSLVLIIIGMTSKKVSTALVNFAAKILKWFKIRNYEKKENSMREALEKYNESAKYIRNNRTVLFRQFSVAIVQQVIYYSVPFCVLHALGLPEQNYILMVALQSMVFGAVSGIPSPGSVGVSEGAFVSIFKPIFTEAYINSAMVLHRGISFYLPVSICAIVVLICTFTSKKQQKS